jgi:CelD/BcsL family acetyltransferase involved in cellulose biosynthesis
LLQEVPEDASLRHQWNALVLGAEKPQVFYTYEWALAVFRAYHAMLRPLLFLAYDENDSLCGVAALATDPDGQRVSFLCATTGDYCDFVSCIEKRGAFVGYVLAELTKRNISDISLANLPADSATVAAIAGNASRYGYHSFMRTGYVCAQVSLASLERRGGAKPVLPRKKMLRRFLNMMGRENPVRLDHARSQDAVEAVLPQLMQAHVARFLVTGRISSMARAERRIFLSELGKLLSEPGWVVLTRMMAGEKVLSWNYGFQFQGTWFWYQPTFDSELEKYSPGFCLLAKVIEEAAENPAFKTVDLGLGAEEYKERFANQTRETLFVTLKSSVLAHYREIVRYRVATMVKASREVEEKVRLMMSVLQRTKQHHGRLGTAELLQSLGRRLWSGLWAGTEVFFYEWSRAILPRSGALQLRPLDLGLLAAAVTEYVDDEETLAYLLRAAQRLRSGTAEGFVLADGAGKPLHFAWLTGFDGFFLSELNARVKPSSPADLMLFDCWTPVTLRGRGHYGQAIELIADRAEAAGKRPWIFSAATNAASVRGLSKAGFEKRYSLLRKKVLWWQRVTGHPAVSAELPTAEASVHV